MLLLVPIMLHPVQEEGTKCEMYLKGVFEIIYCSATYAFVFRGN